MKTDETVDSRALGEMVDKAHAAPHIGAVGSVIYSAGEPERLLAWGGGYINFWLGGWRPFQCSGSGNGIVVLSGGGLLLRRSSLVAVGPLDEGLFLYLRVGASMFRLL